MLADKMDFKTVFFTEEGKYANSVGAEVEEWSRVELASMLGGKELASKLRIESA